MASSATKSTGFARSPNQSLAITNAMVVSVDSKNAVYEGATIHVRNGRIIAIDASTDLNTDVVIDAQGGIVMPGLINAHSHLSMTLFRGIADDMNLKDFLARMMPTEEAVLSKNAVRVGAQLAALECLTGGTTSVLDMYWFPEIVQEVARHSGLRVFGGPTFIEFDGPEPLPFPQRIKFTEEWLQNVNEYNSATTNWIGCHSTYLLGSEHLREIAQLAHKYNAKINVHVSETREEMEDVAKRHGSRTPVQVLERTGLLIDAVLAHGVHLTDDDMTLVAQHNASVVHCPASNFKLASGIIRLPELKKHGINVALGTDGPGSGNDLDLWLAMRLAGYVQKVVAQDASILSANEIVRMATINGAKALGVDHLTGSIEVGKIADLIILDADSPSITPSFDPHVSIATAAGRGDVRSVVVNGKIVVHDHVLTTMDTSSVINEVREFMPQVLTAAK